jgi:hypothetical protein
MNIFISSLISGFEDKRKAVKDAVCVLGHKPLMAEDFGARANSPQITCLNGVRESDAVILILGSRYGAIQESGLSATHEEVIEARNTKPLIIFIESEISEAEPEQVKLIKEVSTWEKGLFRGEFSSGEDLKAKALKAIHDLVLARAVAPLDPVGLKTRAVENLPRSNQNFSQSAINLDISIAAGPDSTIIRPAQMDSKELEDRLSKEALFGRHAIFDKQFGTNVSLENGALCICQTLNRDLKNLVKLHSNGDLLISLPLASPSGGLPAIIEEQVTEQLSKALNYALWIYSDIDPTQRLTHLVPALSISGGSSASWKTQAEYLASPNTMYSSFSMGQDKAPVFLNPAHVGRQAFILDKLLYVEDFIALLRRQWKSK